MSSGKQLCCTAETWVNWQTYSWFILKSVACSVQTRVCVVHVMTCVLMETLLHDRNSIFLCINLGYHEGDRGFHFFLWDTKLWPICKVWLPFQMWLCSLLKVKSCVCLRMFISQKKQFVQRSCGCPVAEVLKARLDGDPKQPGSRRCPYPWQGCWNWVIFRVLSNPSHFVILC